MKSRTSTTIIVTLIILCLGACAPKRNDYSDFRNPGNDRWVYSDVMTFGVNHPDSIADGKLDVIIRHTDDYEYSNIWLEVKYTDATTGDRTDTLNIALADVYGNWLGKGSGVWKQSEKNVARRLRHRSGCPVSVRHIMRVDTLRAIDLVGIRFYE